MEKEARRKHVAKEITTTMAKRNEQRTRRKNEIIMIGNEIYGAYALHDTFFPHKFQFFVLSLSLVRIEFII